MLWNNSLETGIEVIDLQHQEIFRWVDILLDDSSPDTIIATLNFLERYVVEHFLIEESMQASSNYPEARAHKKMHADFVELFENMCREYRESGHTFENVARVNRTVVSWLQKHIMVQDRNFAEYSKARIGK